MREYNSSQNDYIQDITHLKTFGGRVYVNIPVEKRLKSRKVRLLDSREGYFVGYTSTNIYIKQFFSDTRKFEIIRDLEFLEYVKNDDSLQANGRDGISFYFLDISLIEISAYSISSPLSANTLIEGLDQDKTPQDLDHEETEGEISSTRDSDSETSLRRSAQERHESKI